ncbi:unnamed protein product, partial [Scytosiphon promiscuus]
RKSRDRFKPGRSNVAKHGSTVALSPASPTEGHNGDIEVSQMSSLAAVVVAASAVTSALAITAPQRTVADGSSFIPPPSCTATATSHAPGAATATLSSAAVGPRFTSCLSRRSVPPRGIGSASGFSLRWIHRHPEGVPVAGRDRPLLAEAPGSSSEGAEGTAAAVGSSPPTETGNGGSEGENRSEKRDELELRQRKFTKAMTNLGYTSRWKAVSVLIAEAGRVGLPLNVICLNAAMSVLARSGRWYEALDLLSKMRRRALLIDVGADAEQGKMKLAGGALLSRDADEGLAGAPSGLVLPEPDAITFNAAISACGRGNKWKPAVELLDIMRLEGLVPDGFSYSAAISACKNCEQWEMALELLNDMKRRGMGKDRHSLNAAIAACATAGRWKPALEILKGMETDGPDPDLFTYGSVIDALAQGGKLDLALQTLRRMRSDPSRYPAPNTVCHNAALMALMREGRWREARELLTEVAAASEKAGFGGEAFGEG